MRGETRASPLHRKANSMKRYFSLVIGLLAAISLTGCNPPLPPEVRTAIMEQQITCESGEVVISSEWNLEGLGTYLADTMVLDCSELSITQETDAEQADVFISGSAGGLLDEMEFAPLMLDAAVVVSNLDELGFIELSPQTLLGIFNGAITSWDDASILSDNPGMEIPDYPITLIPKARSEVNTAFESWMSFLTGEKFRTGFEIVEDFDYYEIADAEYGSMGLISFLDNFDAYLLQLAISTGEAPEDFVSADLQSIESAGTQIDIQANSKGLGISVQHDSEPEAPAGSDTVNAPYGAIFPINIFLSASSSLAVRALAFYAIRQDSQGNFEQFSLAKLPEKIRLASGAFVSKGLPEPVFTEEQLSQLGLD
jgi:phosphate transport system substrate-binding protein